jgi:hypothetical protein
MRRRSGLSLVATILCVTLVTGGCSSLGSGGPTAVNDGESPGTARATASQPPPIPTVAKPWTPGGRELGVNVLWNSAPEDDSVTRAESQRLLNYVVTLNANSVALNIPYFMGNARSSTVEADSRSTPSTGRVRIFFEEAAARKIRATLRPYLDEQSLLPSWRGKITPGNRDRWFTSYQNFLLPYAQVAQATGVSELVIGVELNSIQADTRWNPLISSVREVFHGKITYSANFDAYQHKMATPAVNDVGIDAYFGVTEPDTATVDALAAAWVRWIDKYAAKNTRTLVLHEVGIAAQDGAYAHPAQWGTSTVPLNLGIQDNWYAAVCKAAEQTSLGGMYFWNVSLRQNPGHEDPRQNDRMTFIDRPAEATLRICYAHLAG